MIINASELDYHALNDAIRAGADDCTITNCLGQRFIGAGLSQKQITIHGTPGNALGAYLNGAELQVFGNAQDAVGDTMNQGRIIVHGNVGDAAGYAMRGGEIYVRGNAGYRTGIHMKAYGDTQPVIVIGGRVGSFLGEYLAGGLILVLGLHQDGKKIVSNFPGAGMHGGRMILRSDCANVLFPSQVSCHRAAGAELDLIETHVRRFCDIFSLDADWVLDAPFTVAVPDSHNPYRQMYVAN